MSATSSKPRKRLPFVSFSLRTLLAAITVFGVWLGWRVTRANRQRDAAAAIRAHGGYVYYDFQYSAKDRYFYEDRISDKPPWLIERAGIDFLHDVELACLWAGGQPTSRRGSESVVSQLDYLPHLRVLYLERSQFSDASLETIAGMPELEELRVIRQANASNRNVTHRRLTHRGLEKLAALKRLRSITIDGVVLDDRSLAALARIESLEELVIFGSACYFTDEGLSALSHLGRLRTLALPEDSLVTEFTDEGVRRLVELKNLESVNLRGAELTDEGLWALSVLPKLKNLEISRPRPKEIAGEVSTYEKFSKKFRWNTFHFTQYRTLEDDVRDARDSVERLYGADNNEALFENLEAHHFEGDAELGRQFIERATRLNDPTADELAALVRPKFWFEPPVSVAKWCVE